MYYFLLQYSCLIALITLIATRPNDPKLFDRPMSALGIFCVLCSAVVLSFLSFAAPKHISARCPPPPAEPAQMLLPPANISDRQSLIDAACARFALDLVSSAYRDDLWKVYEHFAKKGAKDFEGRRMDAMVKEAVRGLNIPRGKLLETTLAVQAVFVWRAAQLQNSRKYRDMQSFLTAYPDVACEPVEEHLALYMFAEFVALCLKYKSAKANKGWYMKFASQMLEGRDARYVTGSGQTHQTSLRVNILAQESGVAPIPRPDRRASNSSGCVPKRKAGVAGVTGTSALVHWSHFV